MTFDEFKQLALHPPKKDEPTIFRIKAFYIDNAEIEMRKDMMTFESVENDHNINMDLPYYPCYSVQCLVESYALSLADAEQAIKRIIHESEEPVAELYCIYVDELPLGDNTHMNCVSRCLYDCEANLIEQSMCSDTYINEEHTPYRHFRGRNPETIRFKVGDIVEVFSGDQVSLAVVVDVPPSIERCYQIAVKMCRKKGLYRHEDMPQQQWEDYCFNNGYVLDETDDCYTVLDAADYESHSHVSSLHVLKPRFPIPQDLQELYKSFYEGLLKEEDNYE